MSEHDALIDRLRRAALAADPPPPELEASARAAFGMGRLDDELAELLHDTAAVETAGVRDGSADAPRLVSFGTNEVGADVELVVAGDGYRVTGVVSGPVVTAALQTPTTVHDLTLDEHGRFRHDGLAGAAMRLELRTESGYTVVTPWVRVG
jgi:hypothetical protein